MVSSFVNVALFLSTSYPFLPLWPSFILSQHSDYVIQSCLHVAWPHRYTHTSICSELMRWNMFNWYHIFALIWIDCILTPISHLYYGMTTLDNRPHGSNESLYIQPYFPTCSFVFGSEQVLLLCCFPFKPRCKQHRPVILLSVKTSWALRCGGWDETWAVKSSFHWDVTERWWGALLCHLLEYIEKQLKLTVENSIHLPWNSAVVGFGLCCR